MDFWNFFFRLEKDDFKFEKFGTVHLIMFCIMVIGALLIYKFRKNIRANKRLRKTIGLIFLLTILLQQSMFLYFYLVVSNIDLENALPLYTCRIALYTTFFGILLNSSNLKSATVYFGLAGGIVPMIIPDLQPYAFPHALYVSFFVTHFSVFWAALMFLFVDKYNFDKSGFVFMCKFVNVFLIASVIANIAFDANYAYSSSSPVFKGFFGSLPKPLYFLLVVIAYNLSNLIIYRVGNKLKEKIT
ncbi:hypothetical protein ING2D1G_0134 [Peptoniphilus sp. ING2-D1G]|nr:hypothetical protein ING2D1G_0134 [Peptoniphilus sp. ING2-D1G]